MSGAQKSEHALAFGGEADQIHVQLGPVRLNRKCDSSARWEGAGQAYLTLSDALRRCSVKEEEGGSWMGSMVFKNSGAGAK